MKKIRILPYSMGSESAKKLAHSLEDKGFNVLRIYPDRNYIPYDTHVLINWGYSGRTKWLPKNGQAYLNPPQKVRNTVDKLRALKIMERAGISTVEFTTRRSKAKEWNVTYARTKIRASGGKGIEIIKKGQALPNASLYTKKFTGDQEYRVHVFKGEVFDYAKKYLKYKERDKKDKLVKNHKNGWTFIRGGIILPRAVRDEAVKAVNALGIDFGAVDVMYDLYKELPAILEVNTAPGLAPTTLERYTNRIVKFVGKVS